MVQDHRDVFAYVIGVALGDGNLSRPNKRATRLRVTCDSKYPNTAQEMVDSLSVVFPTNRVSITPGPKETYINISVYSNRLNEILPWKVGAGSKMVQCAHVPGWIQLDKRYVRACLRGLIQTDGSIYRDRTYLMVNFTNNIRRLAADVKEMIEFLGYKPRIYCVAQKSGNLKYTVRLSRNVQAFIDEISLRKY